MPNSPTPLPSRSTPRATPKLILHGCYHTGNFGDRLLLDLLGAHISSNGPCDIVTPWPGTMDHDRVQVRAGRGAIDCLGAQAAIFGGGGYLNDGGGNRGAVRRLLRYSVPAMLWRASRVPYIVVGVGAGPVTSATGARRIRAVCAGASRLCVRDRETADVLIGLGISATDIEVTADLVLTLTRDDLPSSAVADVRRLLGVRQPSQRRLALHISTLAHQGLSVDRVAELVARETNGDDHIRVYWIVDHGDRQVDAIRQAVARFVPRSAVIEQQPHWTTAALISEMDAVVTTKLHVGITAWAMNVPTCGYSVHPKSKRFYAQIGRERFQADVGSDPMIISHWLRELVSDPVAFAAESTDAREKLPLLAKRNFDVVDEFLASV